MLQPPRSRNQIVALLYPYFRAGHLFSHTAIFIVHGSVNRRDRYRILLHNHRVRSLINLGFELLVRLMEHTYSSACHICVLIKSLAWRW